MARVKFLTVIYLFYFASLKVCPQTLDYFRPIAYMYELFEDDDNYTLLDMERLIGDKKAAYNKFVRPKMNQAKPLNIYVGFLLTALREVDEVREKISIGGGLLLHWADEKMSWNTSEYGGIKTFTIEQGDFWTPMINLVNTYEKYEKIGGDSHWLLRFSYKGHVLFFPSDVFTATCSMDVTFYPWDTQHCTFQFALVSQLPEEVQFYKMNEKIDTTYFSEHGGWDIIDTRIIPAHQNIVIDIKMTIKRKPSFIVVNVVLPIIFLSSLSMLGFLIPTESGERLSYGMTVLLAIAVFLTIISDTLPKSGKTIPVLCYYLVALLVYGIFILCGITVSMRVYFTSNDEEVPIWCVRLLCALRCRKLKNEHRDHSDGMTEMFDLGYDSKRQTNETKTDCIYAEETAESKSCDDLATDSSRCSESISTKSKVKIDTSVTWQDCSRVLDMVFFNFSWLVLLVFTVVFFVSVVK